MARGSNGYYCHDHPNGRYEARAHRIDDESVDDRVRSLKSGTRLAEQPDEYDGKECIRESDDAVEGDLDVEMLSQIKQVSLIVYYG